jgi:ATP-dependent Clp protease protease subunit
MASNTGRDEEKIAVDCDRNLWLDAGEAIEYGLADTVLEHMPAGVSRPKED